MFVEAMLDTPMYNQSVSGMAIIDQKELNAYQKQPAANVAFSIVSKQ
jgi:hypothetical protein